MKTATRPDRPVSDYHLLAGLFFRLLPYQILLIVINAVNGIVDGLVASNVVGTAAMSAIGLYAPLTHFLYALSIMMVSGSQLLYGAYLGKQPESVHSVFSVDLLVSLGISLVTSLVMVLAAVTNAVSLSVNDAAQKKLMAVVLPIVDGFAGVSLTSLFLIPAMKMNGLYVANILNGVIRDDCLPFDPAMGVQIREPQSPEHNIGTRLVFRISRKVEYQNLLGCNVLTISI